MWIAIHTLYRQKHIKNGIENGNSGIETIANITKEHIR